MAHFRLWSSAFTSLGSRWAFAFQHFDNMQGKEKGKPVEHSQVISVSGKKKAHKHKLFGPVALGTTPGLALKQTQFVPGTNSGCPEVPSLFYSGTPACPWDKPGLSLGQSGGEWRQKKFMC